MIPNNQFWFNNINNINNSNFPTLLVTEGTYTDLGDYAKYTFDTPGTYEINITYVPLLYNNTARIGVFGGGGGGGGMNGGAGGGASAFREYSNVLLTVGKLKIVVGAGGAGGVSNTSLAEYGKNSRCFNVVSRGGGAGASGGLKNLQKGGGNGGGSARSAGYNDGETLNDFRGGLSASSGVFGTGGGGGAGENGGDGTNLINGKGGDGKSTTIFGVLKNICGGGGGGCTDSVGTAALGGLGGGGNGGVVNGSSATDVGSGGGGGGVNGGAGYKGAVVIIVPKANILNNPYDVPIVEKNLLLDYQLGVNARYDQASVIKLQNGTFLMAVSVYGVNADDYGQTIIKFYTSLYPNREFTYLSEIGNLGEYASYMPSIYQKNDGTIICLFLNLFNASPFTKGRIVQKNSTDNGATWGSNIILRSNANEELDSAPRVLNVSSTGRLIFCFGIGQFITLPYSATGYTMYSDNEGGTWTTSPNTLSSPDSQLYESGIIEKTNGLLYRYFRSGTNNLLYAAPSTDDGITWGAVISLGVPASTSTSVIVKYGGYFYCIFNPGSRTAMLIYKSATLLNDWVTYKTIENNVLDHFIEPYCIIENGYLTTIYSNSPGTSMYFDLYSAKTKLD